MIKEIVVTDKIHKFFNHISKLNWQNYQCEDGYLFVDCPKLFGLLMNTCNREQKITVDINEAYLRFLFNHISNTNRKYIILFLPETGIWLDTQKNLLFWIDRDNLEKEFLVYTYSPDILRYYADNIVYV